MLKTRTIITAVLLLLSSWLTAQEPLNQYLETAARNNPKLKAGFNDYMAALEQVPQVKSLPDPQLAFGYFISPVETRVGPQQFRISASQMFPWFGTLQARENAAVQTAKAKYQEFLESRAELYKDVKSVYFDLYFNNKSIDIIRENLILLQSIRKIVNVKIEAGKVSMADEYRLMMEINDLENQITLLMDRQQVLEVEFSSLLNLEEATSIQLPDSLWRHDIAFTKAQVLDSIRQQNHRLLQLQMNQAALAYKKEAARRDGMPKINIGLDYTVIGEGENNLSGTDAFMFPKVGISVPLYRNKYKAMVQQVAFEEAANQHRTENTFNSMEALLEKTWQQYLDAKRRIRLNEVQMELAAKSLRLLESEYTTAGENFEEILRMERKLLKYKLEFEKAKADKQAAIAFVHYLMGK